jgi:hypothetical protein
MAWLTSLVVMQPVGIPYSQITVINAVVGGGVGVVSVSICALLSYNNVMPESVDVFRTNRKHQAMILVRELKEPLSASLAQQLPAPVADYFSRNMSSQLLRTIQDQCVIKLQTNDLLGPVHARFDSFRTQQDLMTSHVLELNTTVYTQLQIVMHNISSVAGELRQNPSVIYTTRTRQGNAEEPYPSPDGVDQQVLQRELESLFLKITEHQATQQRDHDHWHISTYIMLFCPFLQFVWWLKSRIFDWLPTDAKKWVIKRAFSVLVDILKNTQHGVRKRHKSLSQDESKACADQEETINHELYSIIEVLQKWSSNWVDDVLDYPKTRKSDASDAVDESDASDASDAPDASNPGAD